MRIGVFCSGGDAPGMNACTRAVVRGAISRGHEVIGIRRGYQGLLSEDFYTDATDGQGMSLRSVSDWSRLGGARLFSNRSEEFRTEEGQRKGAAILRQHEIDALIPIGGDGTFRGAISLASHWQGQIVGCPGTIDNDLCGTDYTIGFSTAVQTAVEAVDKIRDTAASHERMFLIEVMGRHTGHIAAYTALASGAEVVCLPETPTDVDAILADLRRLKELGKSSILMIVAEGDEKGGAKILHEQLQAAQCPFSMRVVILGHLQRGGSPTPEDRILAGRLGDAAVRGILDGRSGVMAGLQSGRCVLTSFQDCVAEHHPISSDLLELIATLAS